MKSDGPDQSRSRLLIDVVQHNWTKAINQSQDGVKQTNNAQGPGSDIERHCAPRVRSI